RTGSPTCETRDPTGSSRRISNSEPLGRTAERKGARQASAANNSFGFTMRSWSPGPYLIKMRSGQRAKPSQISKRKKRRLGTTPWCSGGRIQHSTNQLAFRYNFNSERRLHADEGVQASG